MQEFTIMDDRIGLHAKLDTPKDKGKYPLVILVHGLTGDMEERHLVAAQETMNEIGFGVLRVEMYGHGESGGDFREHTLFKWISNLMTVTDYARSLPEVTDLYLCGHSQGGLLVMLAAGMRPDDYRAIILLSPAIVILDGARKGNMLSVTFDPAHIKDAYDFDSQQLGGNYFRCAQFLHVEDATARYDKPVLLVHGDMDEAVPVEYSIEADRQYKNSKLVIIPNDNHCFDFHLDEMCAAITDFLNGEM